MNDDCRYANHVPQSEQPMKYVLVAGAIGVMAMLQACSQPATTAPAAAAATTAADPVQPASAPVAAPVSGDPHQACNLVTAAEMSTIVGGAMVATPQDADGVSNCKYAPRSGRGSSVDFTVMPGDGESTLQMDRDMKNHDRAADARFAGIGDDAVVVPPAVQVRQGKDLLVFTLYGIDDEPATLKKIVDIAKTRL
jgi:hypothetical protein